MKPRYRYNWKLEKWEQVFRIDLDFIYINPIGHNVKLPGFLFDTYRNAIL